MGMTKLGAACAATLTAWAPVAASDLASPQPVVEAERAFAAAVKETGFKKGFLAYAAPDGILFEMRPMPAHELLEASPDDNPADPPLEWWPQWAGMARSGDLGFTTGPANIPVRYFTVWQKQADGSWKWIYDGGPRLKKLMEGGPGMPVTYAPTATAEAGSPEKALAEVKPLEAELAAAAATDLKGAYLDHLAEDGLVAGSSEHSMPGRAEQEAELDRRPAAARITPAGAVASGAGDMTFTYGEVSWEASSKPRRAHYARIWQKRSEGWRLLAEVWLAAPPVPAPVS